MRVLISERKGADHIREGRVTFEEAIRSGTVFMIVAPLEDSTRGLIDAPEFDAMDSTALIINVARGGIVVEEALVNALKERSIGGAACDAFDVEPATKENSILLDPGIPNLVLSPHIAWYSSRTIKGTNAVVKGAKSVSSLEA